MLNKNAVVYAVLGGSFAACASLFAKLALDPSVFSSQLFNLLVSKVLSEDQASFVARVTSTTLLFVCNALMWLFYSKALSTSQSSTISITATQNLANFTLTALFGYAVFGKHVGPSWWAGISLIVAGLATISTSQQNSDKPNLKPRNKSKNKKKKS